MVAQPPINSPAVSTTTRNLVGDEFNSTVNNLPDSADSAMIMSTNVSNNSSGGEAVRDELEKSSSGSSPSATTTTMTNSHHNHHYHNHHHYSQHYVSKRDRQIATSTSKTNLYIKGLKEETTDKDLYDMCAKYGEIKSTKAIIDKVTTKCKGYGFVDFKRQDDARHALAELKKDQHDVQLAKQREQDPTNLYFANLPLDVDEDMLNAMLKDKFAASVNSTRIMREKNGNSKGVGFARIDDDKLCDQIIMDLNSQPFPEHSNKSKLIMVKLADSCSLVKSTPPPLPPPPPPPFSTSLSMGINGKSGFYRQPTTANTFHVQNNSGAGSLENSTNSFVSSTQNGSGGSSSGGLNDSNNNQYGMSNLNYTTAGAGSSTNSSSAHSSSHSGHHHHSHHQHHHNGQHNHYRHNITPAQAQAQSTASNQIYGHYNQHAAYLDYNNYPYAFMLDQNGYLTTSGHQAYNAMMSGHTNIPLLQTPQQTASYSTTSSNGALLPQPLSQPTPATQQQQQTTNSTTSQSGYTPNPGRHGSYVPYQQTAAPNGLIHQQQAYYAAQTAPLTNPHQISQMSAGQIPYYIIQNPYQQQQQHQQPHQVTYQQSYHQHSQQIHQPSVANTQTATTAASSSTTPSSTPMSSQSSSLTQNMSNLSITNPPSTTTSSNASSKPV